MAENLVLLGETLEFASDRLEVVSTDVLPASELEVREEVVLHTASRLFTAPMNY